MIAVAIIAGVGFAYFSLAVATVSIIGALTMAAPWVGSSLLFENAAFGLSLSSGYPGTNAEETTAAHPLPPETL
jgi:hypothetical protein